MTSFYSKDELKEIGFRYIGENVLLSRKTSIYGAENISIGSNTRIDDFCIISGNIILGEHVHIAAYCALFAGKTGIEMKDFSAISSRGIIYAESDDYSGRVLTNPTVPNEYKHIICGKVVLHKHVLIGAGCIVLPGVTLNEGSAFGSMSLINTDADEWTINVGTPCKIIKRRERDLLDFERQLIISEKLS